MKKLRTSLFIIALFLLNLPAFSQGVAINADGTAPDANAMLDVKATNKGFLPPRVLLDNVNTVAPLAGATAGMVIYNQGGIAPDGLYMWDGVRWTRLNNQTVGTTVHYIGELYLGGIIYWVDNTGIHGLIAGLDDLDGGTGFYWSNVDQTLIGAAAQDFYNGAANTNAILAQAGHISSAAKLCRTIGPDWYLPSQSELELLSYVRVQINAILANDGNAATNGLIIDNTNIGGHYWSSTEKKDKDAYTLQAHKGRSSAKAKKDLYRVRAVRSF